MVTMFCPKCETKMRLVANQLFVKYIEVRKVSQLITYDCEKCRLIIMVEKEGNKTVSIEHC